MEGTQGYFADYGRHSTFGHIHPESLVEFASDTIALSYWILITAMRGFTLLAIPIWLVILVILTNLNG